jgi:hypothetical protein
VPQIDIKEDLKQALSNADSAAKLFQKPSPDLADLFQAVQLLAASNQILIRAVMADRVRA